MMLDQFTEMLRLSAKRPLVYSVVFHPFVFGQPFRMAALRWALDEILKQRDDLRITTPGAIAEYCAGLPAGIIPGSGDRERSKE